ncbi:dihydrodipicolinate synthase family protein [Mesorhizobium sp. B2-7-3]|uniref:dihydrodipicolinate synthase family protein n=1 Tax=Mesorhizobium sp. B2-7-3 TaxID=2589907 RepID=UPI00112BA47C|nr:dihydrodipicolinate synthase family protein [Mesorhizobium sp. B2-7-3]TPJ18898.1 dihydrodipicolinate synthase family protein [Mesorhizobium sp. B2-7-3]
MADLKGINLAMQTPFNENGDIEYGVFGELIDKFIDAGVHGLVLGAGTGQHPYLTEAECNRLYELGAKRIDGRCSLICQSSALNMDEVIRRSKHAESIGADAIMVLPPYFEGPSDDDGILRFYSEVNDAVGIDIVGYNIPQATGLSVSPDLFRRLSQLSNFNFIKDSGGDFTTHQEYLQISGGVLNGCDTITVYALMAGVPGVIWGSANYMPKEAVELYEHVAAKRLDQGLALWAKMLPSLLYIWRAPYTPSVLKAAQWRGFGTGHVRKPLGPLSASQEKALRATLEHLDA